MRLSEVIEEFFLSFNRDPNTCQALVSHFCKTFQDADLRILQLACNDLARLQSGMLPQVNVLEEFYKKSLPKPFHGEAEACDLCGGGGLTYSLFSINSDGKRQELGGPPQIPTGRYSEQLIGCCACSNGDPYRKSKTTTSPLSWLVNSAKTNGRDCVFELQSIVRDLNRRSPDAGGNEGCGGNIKQSLQRIEGRHRRTQGSENKIREAKPIVAERGGADNDPFASD